MNDDRLIELLASIAASLAEIAHNIQRDLPDEPNLQRPLEAYITFDWSSIDATVVKFDEYGVAIVEWGGRMWTRRSPENKFGSAIWFSRSAGRDEKGDNRYLRLITFREVSDPEPIARSTERALAAAKTAQPATIRNPQPVTNNSQHDSDAEFGALPSVSQRPRPPETVKDLILARARKQPGPQNDEGRDRKRLWAALSNLCGSHEDNIRALLNYFYGPDTSTKALTEGQCKAIVEWINSERQLDGTYVPDMLAVIEYRAILAQWQPELTAA